MSNIKDLTFYSQEFLKILSKKSQLIPLVHNPYQLTLTKTVEELKRANKPVRIIVLKCRQIGCSTWGSSLIYHDAATSFYKKAVIIADDGDNTSNIFNMSKRYWDFSPENVRPLQRYSNKKALVFENPDDKTRDEEPGLLSSINVETAGKLTAGRSGTIHLLHCSEFAFWPNAATVSTGLFQAVPREPGTIILIESTANGVAGTGEEFYNKWQSAYTGDSDYVPLFFPWQDNPEYELPIPDGIEFTHYEKHLMDTVDSMSPRNIVWRRWKIKNDMGTALLKPEEQFNQEFPYCPEVAFVSSGRPVLDISQIRADIERINSSNLLDDMDARHGAGIGTVNPCQVYYPKKDDTVYALGADVAEGLESGDFSAITVVDKNYRQVASYHAHIPPDIFGREICQIGEYFNNCIVAPEINNHGHATMSKIKELGYLNIYSRVVKEQRDESPTKKIGWHTNRKTKMEMLDNFVALYRERELEINDVNLLKEMATLTIMGNGDVELGGKDRVVAMCISLMALKKAHANNLVAMVPPNKDKGVDFQRRLHLHAKSTDLESHFDLE